MTTTQRLRFRWIDCYHIRMIVTLGVLATPASAIAEPVNARAGTTELIGALIAIEEASTARLKELKSSGTNTVVFMLGRSNDKAKMGISEAIANSKRAGLAIAYWIEVARSPELADEHPEWMASLQTHDEWRRFFPNAPRPKSNEVTKTYPWIPILSRDPFHAQRERILTLLSHLPTPKLIFLNDLQGAPSACGCGNPLCRWTSDYGNRRTTIPMGDNAATLFVKAIRMAIPQAEVIPVWVTECEEHDGSPNGLCHGVGCFDGICWKAYNRQLMPLSEMNERIAVLALYQEFQRYITFGGSANVSWVEYAIKTFETMPPKQGGTAIPASRIIAVVQGWNVSAAEIEAQKTAAKNAGANGYVVAHHRIDQSWSPKIVRWK